MIQRFSNKVRSLNAEIFPQHALLPPKWLVLGVNNQCNLHCKMCDVGVNYSESNFYSNLMGSTPLNMPLDLFMRIADQASEQFPSAKLGFAFTEPLIYPHLGHALKYAHSKKLYTSITTNGLGLKKWAAVMAETRLDELNLSLDGPEDIHNFIRGNKNSFSLALAGIRELASKSTHTKLSVFCVVTECGTSTGIYAGDEQASCVCGRAYAPQFYNAFHS